MTLAPFDKGYGMKIANFEVEYEEIFKLKELYKEIMAWTKSWGYKSCGEGEPENLYMELIGDKGQKNHHIWWRFERVEDEFVKFFLKIDYQTIMMTDIEIMHKGQKTKTQRGDVILRVEGWLHLDHKKEMRDHWLLKHFINWFMTHGYREKIDAHKKELWFEVYNLHDTIKHHLNMSTLTDLPHPYAPKRGMP